MRKFAKFLIWTGIVLGVVIGILRLTAIRWWQVPEDDPLLGASINPTLRAGDWLVLWRLTEPKFGDLVLCPDPTDPAEIVIGRIVGEENDTIKIQGDNLWINNSPMRTESACTERTFKSEDPNTGNEVEQYCDQENLGGHVHMRGNISQQRSQSSVLITELKVGEGQVYLVSDNRLFPFDSRRFGVVPRATCKEAVFFRLVSAKGYSDVASRFTFIR